MVTPRPTNPSPGSSDPSSEASLVRRYVQNVAGADEALAAHIAPATRRAATAFLGREASDLEDVIQETCLAVLEYVRQQDGFQGDILQFAATVARNRCRNLANSRSRHPHVELESLREWIASPERSPLDLLEEKELHLCLQRVLDSLSNDCRRLLRGFYLEDRPIEQLRRTLGLSTVQGVYYRRAKCLEKAELLLNQLLGRCSRDE